MPRTRLKPDIPQVRLPGQAAAPDGPVDMTAMFVMHWAFRRDLDRFVAAVCRTPVEDRAAWRALARRWGLFCHVLHDHHTGEDQGLWPALLSRVEAVGSAAEREVLLAMEEEHSEIDPLLESVSQGLERVANLADNDARDAVEARMVAARERLAHHLGHEETEALALVQKYLAPADWRHIEKTYFQQTKSPREVVSLVSWLLHELPAPTVARVLAGAAPIRLLWRLFLRNRFAQRDGQVFRYALTPGAIR